MRLLHLLLIAALGCAAQTPYPETEAAQAPTFQIEHTPSPLPNDTLFAISASSRNDIWAVGQTTIHFDGSTWKAFPAPHLSGQNTSALAGVAVVSPSDVWAAGFANSGGSNPRQLLEHWDGTRWSDFPGPVFEPGDQPVLAGIAAISPKDIWAAGYVLTRGALFPLLEHFDGKNWSLTEVAVTYGILRAITAISSDDVWAVGYSDQFANESKTLVLHWNGRSWTVFPSPNVGIGDNQLNSVIALGPNNVWAVGLSTAVPPPQEAPTLTLLEHWDGNSWSVVDSPNVGPHNVYQSNRLFGIAAESATNLWAFGSFFAADGSGQQHTLVLQGNGKAWRIVSSPNPPPSGFASNVLFGGVFAGTGNLRLVGGAAAAPHPITGTLVLHTQLTK